MSNAYTFVNSYVAKIQQLGDLLLDLRGMNDQLVQDPTIVTRYFATSSDPRQPLPRTDIAPVDVTNASSAVVQLLFTYDSGSPSQKSYLYKVFP